MILAASSVYEACIYEKQSVAVGQLGYSGHQWIDGSYMQIAYQVGNFAFSVEFAAHKDKFVLKLNAKDSAEKA